MKVNKFRVRGLDNNTSTSDIEQSVLSHKGINAVRVDMNAETVTVDYDDRKYTQEDIENFVNEAGLNVTEVEITFSGGGM
jgi:copper chaperone CopZ